MFKEIKKENLSKIIIKSIEEHIVVNNLKPGDKLPTENELAEKFKVGRSSVREALKTLENIGLVCGKQRVGTVLSSEGADPFLLPFIFGLVLEDVGIDHLSELRLAIEQGAARLAVKNATDQELNELMELAVEVDNLKYRAGVALNETEKIELARLEVKFHNRLVELSHNPIFTKFSSLWGIFFSRVRDSGELSLATKAGYINIVKKIRHTEIVEAIIERDEEKAANAIKKHLVYWLERKETIPTSSLVKMVKNQQL